MRFEMARALVARAEERVAWIGDDHGDPYERALIARSVPIEMHVGLKEIFDHLRSALDYCAHEICEAATGTTTGAQIYFPITARGFASKDFPSRIGKLMPGLSQARPDLVHVFAQFQPFASVDNGWLADLATLTNRTKHVELAVSCIDAADLRFTKDAETGLTLYRTRRSDGNDVRVSSLALIEAPHGLEGADWKLVYLRLASIDQDLLAFLRPAPKGVRRIMDTFEFAL
jgi:hypothetical protein